MASGAHTVRAARPRDRDPWMALWADYCAALGATVPGDVSDGIWSAILDDSRPIGCLLAVSAQDVPVGFANYVLHPHTWSLRDVCYLEDLFVSAAARGSGAARARIEELRRLGNQCGWSRVYWHTDERNYRARKVFDGITPMTSYVRYDIKL